MIRKALMTLLVLGGLLAAISFVRSRSYVSYMEIGNERRSRVHVFQDFKADMRALAVDMKALAQDVASNLRSLANGSDPTGDLDSVDVQVDVHKVQTTAPASPVSPRTTVAKPPRPPAPPPVTTRRGQVTVYGRDGGRKILGDSETGMPAPRWTIKLETGEYGTTPESAQVNVLEKALRTVDNWVREQTGISGSVESSRYLSLDLLKQQTWIRNGPRVYLAVDLEDGPKSTKLYGAEVEIELLYETQELLKERAHSAHVHDLIGDSLVRSWMVSKGVLGLLVLALVSMGYCHLDDRTRGYYSRPLGFGAAVVAAGLVGFVTLLL